MPTSTTWPAESKKLRAILLQADLTEELKWGKPCYTFQGSNVVLILALKNYCALLFCKGALLKDSAGLLIKPGENTQAARQMRFTSLAQIVEQETVLRDYLRQAIQVEKSGLEITYKRIEEYAHPAELQQKLAGDPVLKKAFHALTPGRQRAYLMHFSAPKQSRTRQSRIEKAVARILAGKGLHDR
jgi:uncharacterized protein YdeI (YjbR/CyaY-like superfamily)